MHVSVLQRRSQWVPSDTFHHTHSVIHTLTHNPPRLVKCGKIVYELRSRPEPGQCELLSEGPHLTDVQLDPSKAVHVAV